MANTIAVFTLVSPLHDEMSVMTMKKEFFKSLGVELEDKGSDFSTYGRHTLDLIYVCTGGTENLFLEQLPTLQKKSRQPIYLLTSGKSNSLAASMEILSYMRQHYIKGEIIHGDSAYMAEKISLLSYVCRAKSRLRGSRLGIIGKPSDWLISTGVDKKTVSDRLGVELVDIPMEELIHKIDNADIVVDESVFILAPNNAIRQSIPGALRIYEGLKNIVKENHLNGLTIRCFDLLTSVHNTGCFALARLNAEGIVAGCEGDVPAMLSMFISHALSGISGFQANPAKINPETGEIVFAHCTVPFNMVKDYQFDTHFESGIGVGIRGILPVGPVTVFKVAGNLSRYFAEEGTLTRNLSEKNLCRTQIEVRLDDKSKVNYFLKEPIGNHHIILPGRQKRLLETILE
jgi:L-fucose isomerase-like protein